MVGVMLIILLLYYFCHVFHVGHEEETEADRVTTASNIQPCPHYNHNDLESGKQHVTKTTTAGNLHASNMLTLTVAYVATASTSAGGGAHHHHYYGSGGGASHHCGGGGGWSGVGTHHHIGGGGHTVFHHHF